MKTAINGQVLDTKKAHKLGEAAHQDGRRSQTEWIAALYRTPRSKQYFLAGIGGVLTIFREKIGPTQYLPGQRIIPLTERDARTWAMENLAPAVFNLYFQGKELTMKNESGSVILTIIAIQAVLWVVYVIATAPTP